MKRIKPIFALAVAILPLLICVGLDRAVNTSEAYAASQPGASQPIAAGPVGKEIASISLADAPLAAQVAVGALVLLFGLVAVIPAFLEDRER